MTNKKMTNAMALEIALEVLRETDAEKYTEVIEKLDKMLVQVNKKSSANRKPTATQLENEGLREKIVEYLRNTGKRLTVSEMMKEIEGLEELSNQRVTSLATFLYKEGKIDREIEKRKAYFFVK
nr:MAG TPA: hypothetical protein [Caudoviricetes sp.]